MPLKARGPVIMNHRVVLVRGRCAHREIRHIFPANFWGNFVPINSHCWGSDLNQVW